MSLRHRPEATGPTRQRGSYIVGYARRTPAVILLDVETALQGLGGRGSRLACRARDGYVLLRSGTAGTRLGLQEAAWRQPIVRLQ